MKVRKKRDKQHDERLWPVGFTFYSLMNNFRHHTSIEDYLVELNKYDKELPRSKEYLYKMIRIIMLTHVLEHRLIGVISKEYVSSPQTVKEEAQEDVIRKAMRTNGHISRGEAIELINNQKEGSPDAWFIPPILSYVAGYTLGDMVYLYTKILSGDENLGPLLEEFNEKRNNIIHNATSTRLDILSEIDQATSLIDQILTTFDNFDNEAEILNSE